jgi:hypothetical protein
MNQKNIIIISFSILNTIFYICQNPVIADDNVAIKDAYNNTYNVVKIGTHIWTSEKFGADMNYNKGVLLMMN